MTTAEYGLSKAARPFNSHLDKTKLSEAGFTPALHRDDRGYLSETYSQRNMEENGIFVNFVQDNQSMSRKGVLRSLHFRKTTRKPNWCG